MSKWPYQAVTSTWSTWAPGQLATSPSSRCFWPRTVSPSAWWRCTWWWPSWAVSSRSLSRPSPTSRTPSSGIKQTPTIRRSLALRRQWVSTCCEAADWRCCVSVSSLSDTPASLRQWTLVELWKIDFIFQIEDYLSQAVLLLCNKDLVVGVKSWNPPVLHFWRPLLFCWLLCFACMIFQQQQCSDLNIADEAAALEMIQERVTLKKEWQILKESFDWNRHNRIS